MILPKKDLAALGLSPDMIGPDERLVLPLPDVDEARGPLAAAPDLLDARSDVLHVLSVTMQLDAVGDALYFAAPDDLPFRIRAAHAHADPMPADAQGTVRLGLRQAGRFFIETPGGVPLAFGLHDRGALMLALVGRWTAPPIEDWIPNMHDTWLQSMVERTLPAADTWARTALAGQITRLAEHDAVAAAATSAASGSVAAMLDRLGSSSAMKPRAWARTLDADTLDAMEQHALRRAASLEGELDDLFVVLPRDADAARTEWTRLCHRRDDIESVRVLLHEAGAGTSLDGVLRRTDRAGRSARINLGPDVVTDDERLRRVALGDPGAWWGDTAFEVRLI